MKAKFKLLFTVLSVLGLGLTSCGGSGGEQGGQQGGQQPGGEVTPGGDGGETQHTHTYSGYEHDETQHWQVCTGCHEATAKEDHRGGTATCEHKAVCEVCGAEYGELGEHQYGSLIARVAPTCEVSGLAAHYQCSVCHKFFNEQKEEVTYQQLVIDASGHAYGTLVAAEAPDCEHDGHAAYYHCEECNKYFDADKHETTLEALTVAKLGHAYGELIAQVDADCEHSGVAAHYECSRCHKLFNAQKEEVTAEQLVIAPVGHAYGEIVAAEAADCEHGGHEAYYHCSECGKYFTSEKVETTLEALQTQPLGHEYGNLVARQDPTCTDEGMEAHYECSRCHKLFDSDKVEKTAAQLTIAATGHNPSIHVGATNAQCEVAGNTEYWECSTCHHYFSDEECQHEIDEDSWIVPATGHTPVEHPAVEATCTEAGNSKYYSCEHCSEYFSDAECTTKIAANSWVIPATGHTPVHHEAHAATCTENGNSEYWECSVCHHYFSDSECTTEISENSWVIPTTNHSFDEHYPEILTFATFRHAYHHCSVCDKLYMENGAGGYTEIADDDAAWENSKMQYGQDVFGTESNPYTVKYAADLILLKNLVNNTEGSVSFSGKFFKMVDDIDLDGVTAFTPIGNHDSRPFSGTFDGDNHKISNYTYSSTGGLGLFSRVTNGTVKNLKLENFNITGSSFRASPLCGRALNAVFENCHVLSGTITGTYQNGGLIGVAVTTKSIIRNCSSAADVVGTATDTNAGNGGLVGAVHSGGLDIEDSTFSGTVTGAFSGVGDIVGYVINGNTTITRCVNEGTIHTDKEAAGGILGYIAKLTAAANVTITDCENKGSVTATTGNGCGGIFGANVDGSTDSAKPLVLTIDGCVNRGHVTGSAHVGGIAGLPRIMGTGSVIRNCVNAGNVTATAASGYVGGIVSRARIAVENNACLASVVLTNKDTVKTATECAADGTGAAATPGFILTVVDSAGSYSNGYLVYEYTVTVTGAVADIFADGAMVYAWAWGGAVADTGAWYKGYKSGANEIKVFLPTDATNFKVARLDSAYELDWSHKFNESSEVVIADLAGAFTCSVTM